MKTLWLIQIPDILHKWTGRRYFYCLYNKEKSEFIGPHFNTVEEADRYIKEKGEKA